MPTSERAKLWKAVGYYGSVGIELLLSIALGYLAGHWLDRKLGTKWFTLLGFLLGAYAGFRALFVAAKKMQHALELQDHKHHERRRGTGKPDA